MYRGGQRSAFAEEEEVPPYWEQQQRPYWGDEVTSYWEDEEEDDDDDSQDSSHITSPGAPAVAPTVIPAETRDSHGSKAENLRRREVIRQQIHAAAATPSTRRTTQPAQLRPTAAAPPPPQSSIRRATQLRTANQARTSQGEITTLNETPRQILEALLGDMEQEGGQTVPIFQLKWRLTEHENGPILASEVGFYLEMARWARMYGSNVNTVEVLERARRGQAIPPVNPPFKGPCPNCKQAWTEHPEALFEWVRDLRAHRLDGLGVRLAQKSFGQAWGPNLRGRGFY